MPLLFLSSILLSLLSLLFLRRRYLSNPDFLDSPAVSSLLPSEPSALKIPLSR